MEIDRCRKLAVRKLAQIPATQRWKVVAVLVNRRPLFVAANVPKTHPDVTGHDPMRTLHAEIRCLKGTPANKRKGSDLFVIRFIKKGFGMAKPCWICENYLRKSGIERVTYSTASGGFQTLVL